jgi:acyl carrier protein
VRASVVAALARYAPAFGAEITNETPLTDDGLCLDSLALMALIAEIEATHGITIAQTDISLENFGTVGRLVRFIERRPPNP